MASFASSATTCGARKHTWTNCAMNTNSIITRKLSIITLKENATLNLTKSDLVLHYKVDDYKTS